MIRRPPRTTQGRSSAASDVYKRQYQDLVNQFTDLQNQFIVLQQEYNKLVMSYQEQTASLNRLQESFKDFQKQVKTAQSKSIIFEIATILLSAGWGLDVLGVF